jgi:hypothetical protein
MIPVPAHPHGERAQVGDLRPWAEPPQDGLLQSRNGRMGAGPPSGLRTGSQPVWRVWSGTLKPLTRTSGLADVAE